MSKEGVQREAETSPQEEAEAQLLDLPPGDQEIPNGMQAPSPLPLIHQSSEGHSE